MDIVAFFGIDNVLLPKIDLLSFSGLWLSVFSLGNFVGPTISGVLVQVKGFRFTTLIFFVLYLVMLLFDIIEAIKRKIQEKRQSI